jgi:hypothetical protein
VIADDNGDLSAGSSFGPINVGYGSVFEIAKTATG